MSHKVDLDDWFEEPEWTGSPPDRGPGEDWLDDRVPAQRAPLRERPWIKPAAIGAGAVVVLLLALWAAGVFSGGSSAPTRPATTTRPAATTTVKTPRPASVPAPATTLAPGATGAQVKRLQRALAQLGYSPGKVDGGYGPATTAALKQFQQANGLQADGVLGPKTLQALKSKLAAG